MKKIFPCSLMLLAGCATTPPDVAKDQDVTLEFKPRIEKILAGWSTLDIKNVAPFYAKDAGLVFFDVAPLKYSGWTEYEKGFQQVASTWKAIKISLGDLQATRNGNIVWAVYTAPLEIEPKEGAVMKAVTRNTDIFERRADDWIIVHEHVSAPFEPAPPPAATAKKK